MDNNLKAHIEYLLCINIEHVRPISGGDISQAFLLETETEQFFCKVNEGAQAYKMFLAEKVGLEVISKTKAITTPKVLLCEELKIGGFLLMAYIKPKRATQKDMGLLGHQLANLHKNSTGKQFGLESNNFIGSLPQSNTFHTAWHEFYVRERLLPQIRSARDANKLSEGEIPSEEGLGKSCENLFPEVTPSLLHGDLWGGNYLISENGVPYLIDPAVYYGHHEVDIMMTRLFGGFDASFYEAYSEHFPVTGQEKERCELYQLYYLLVHLNLFGRSYYGQVKSILAKYF